MEGQLGNLITLWAMGVVALGCITYKANELEKEEKRRRAKREAQRKREMLAVGARVRRQLTVERFGAEPKTKKKPLRKFCGELATYDNQCIVK